MIKTEINTESFWLGLIYGLLAGILGGLIIIGIVRIAEIIMMVKL